jgi:hypothetical protein
MKTSIWTVINSHLNDALIEMHSNRGAAADRIRFVQELVLHYRTGLISEELSDGELESIWNSIE